MKQKNQMTHKVNYHIQEIQISKQKFKNIKMIKYIYVNKFKN